MSSGSTIRVNAAGRRRSPATLPGYLAGRAPRNKGMQYPSDPPRAEEIVLVMRQAGHDRHGLLVRALVAVLWRGGLRISEALALNETDIDDHRGSLLIRHGKGDKRREAGMDRSGSNSSRPGCRTACRCRPDRCSASSTDPPEAAAGPRPLPEPSCASSPSMPGSGAGSRPINYGTRTPSSSRAKESRSTLSSASSPYRPRDHQHLSARARSQRDHRRRPLSPPADISVTAGLTL
jgi:Phage integrase family